jgi:hypothetical protein
MKLDTPKNCKIIGASFVIGLSMIEILLFGSLFGAFTTHWGKIVAVACTVLVFNLAIWYFALKYHETSENVNNNI